jgi:flagellar hook-associated protein 3
MRVTNKMISDQVMYNLNRSLDRFIDLQSMMSSGRRITKPSDDPVGTQKDIRYRKTLAEIAQYKTNISSSRNLLSSYDSILQEAKNIVTSVYEKAVDMAGDDGYTYDNAGEVAANEVRDLFDRLLSLGNSKVEDRYIFSGYRTGTETFRLNANGVEYAGDSGNIQIDIEANTKLGINLIGSNVFLGQLTTLGKDSNLAVGIDGNTTLADLNLGDGVDLTPGTFTITDNNLGLSATIDISGETTIADVIAKINADLIADPLNAITNITADYGIEGNNLRLTTVDNGLISGVTLVSNLNAGTGIDTQTGKFIIKNDSDSIHVEVDVSDCSTVNDIINAINAATGADSNPLVANVTASINAAGTGLDITDANGTPLGLRIEEPSSSSTTASDLGILGNIGSVLHGAALSPKLDFTIAESGVDQTTAADLGLLGSFSMERVGEGLTPIINTSTPLSLLNNGLGFDLGQIQISQGSTFAILDLGDSAYATVGDWINAINNLGLEITASINDAQTGIQIVSTSTDESLKISDVGSGTTARELGILGSPDLMGSMMVLIDALENSDKETVGKMIGNFEEGIQEILSHLASVGAKVNRLDATDSRLTDLNYEYVTLMSNEEDADLTKLASDLASQENSYQAALIASAKIIQPTLLNFLS